MDAPVLHGARVTVRPLRADDLPALVAIVRSPGVRPWWSQDDAAPDAEIADDLSHDGVACTIEVGGAVAGWLQICEVDDPAYRSVGLDIVLGTSHQNRGLGTEALRLVIRWLFDVAGHHRITIDPACENRRAIRAYEALGFRAIGIARAYERREDGTWRDGLLMDLLAGEQR